MASEIPSLGQDVPLQLKTISNFIVAKGDPSTFPSGFLPNGTLVLIQPGTGEASDLFWTNGEKISCSIQGLKQDPTGPPGNLSGENVSFTIDDIPLSAAVLIFPMGSVGSVPNLWVGIVTAAKAGKINTPTTGTFVAQASTDGDGHPPRH